MGVQKGEKLNQLQRSLPSGLVVTAAWLRERGYSSALLSKYVANGWLEQPARSVYRRPGGALLWQHVVISAQTLLCRPFFVGGRTALEEQGLSHYVSATSPREVHLYCSGSLPSWITKVDLQESVVLHRTSRLFEESAGFHGATWNDDLQDFEASGTELTIGLRSVGWGQWQWPLVMSTPERAVLELLDEVPMHESFHQADMLIEGLRTLSPRRMQTLLENCRNVKVKRLLLWFADRHQLPWRLELKLENVNLGSGKRSLVAGGKLDPTYQITVPRDMYAGQ